MSHAAQIEKLNEARKLIREALNDLPMPMLEVALQEADMNLHWALWNMGEPVELLPQLEDA